MVQTLNTALVWRPFPFPDSPNSVVSKSNSWGTRNDSPTSIVSRSNSWKAREEIVRRFSEPAADTEKLRADQHIKCASPVPYIVLFIVPDLKRRHAIEAYHDAVATLSKTLKTDEVNSLLSKDSSTKPELHMVALQIQRDQKEVLDRRKMGKFIDVLDHYSGVFDVLAQCDFSYMTLIWGGLKFGLIMSKNHHDMLYKFTDMMVDIGLSLPRIQLYRQMLPTGRILEFVSDLYAAVLEFLLEMIAYTQKKTFSTQSSNAMWLYPVLLTDSSVTEKYFTSFTKPFDVEFGRLVTRIRRLQDNIEADARAGQFAIQMLEHASLRRHMVAESLRRTRECGNLH
jgi:hypothetical protein